MTNGFIGEFLILMGAYLYDPVYAYLSVLGVVLGAAYMLWMFKRVFFGAPGELVSGHELPDLSKREMATLAPLLVLVFWMGLFPDHFLRWSKPSVDHLLMNKSNYSLEIYSTGQK